MNNDTFILSNVHAKLKELEEIKDRTDDEQYEFEMFRQMFDCQRLCVEIKIEAAERFLQAHNVPPFLTFGVLQYVKEEVARVCPKLLFDVLKTSLNAQELARMCDDYLKNKYNDYLR